MAKITDFLHQLETDPQLLRDYRGKKAKKDRKDLAKSMGLTDAQADTLQSNDLATIRAAIEEESGGAQLFFVIMLD